MNDLLKVLDMSEDEQYRWCWRNTTRENGLIQVRWYFLEDLAFRLRDEAKKHADFHNSMIDVQQHIEGPTERKQDFVFWAMRSKPIHWIIAALIAKEKEDDRKS